MTHSETRAAGSMHELDMSALDLVAGGNGQTWTCTVTVKPDVTITRCTGPNGEKTVRWDYSKGITL